MNVQMIVTVVAALAAGVLGAVVVSPSDAPSAVDGGELIVLRAEIDELAHENQMLLDRLESLEGRPPVVAMPSSMEAFAAETVREVEEEPAKSSDGGGVDPDALQRQVTDALVAIRAEEERKRDEDREKRRQERFDEQLTKLAEELGLNAYQTNQLRDAMLKQQDQMTAARDAMREGGDWGGMREAMTKMREDMNVQLGTFMTQDQIDKYNESNRGFGGRGGRGGGGRGGRGGF